MAFPNPPQKIVAFNSGPVAPHDIGRQFEEHTRSTAQVIDFLKTVVRSDGRMVNGSVGIEQLDDALPAEIAARTQATLEALLASTRQNASEIQAALDEIRRQREQITEQQVRITAAADAMSRAYEGVQNRLAALNGEIESRITALVPVGLLGAQVSNFYATDEQGSGPLASDYAQVAIAWAEHMPDTIPPNILAINSITGDHWSARWWANQAALLLSGQVPPTGENEFTLGEGQTPGTAGTYYITQPDMTIGVPSAPFAGDIWIVDKCGVYPNLTLTGNPVNTTHLLDVLPKYGKITFRWSAQYNGTLLL